MTYDIALCHPDEITTLIPKSSGWLNYCQYLIRMGDIPSGWLNYWWFLIRMTWILAVSHPDDLTIGSISSRWLMGIVRCHPDDLQYSPISSGWHNIIWSLSHPDEISMLMHKSSGWLSYRQYLIRMTYGYCTMSSGWLAILSYLIRMT